MKKGVWCWLALSVLLISSPGCHLTPWSKNTAASDEDKPAAAEDDEPAEAASGNDRNRNLGKGLRSLSSERGTGVDPQARDIERSLGYRDGGGLF